MTDIVHTVPLKSYIVTGFFTPDYRAIAARFSANLKEHGIPHHLYAVPAEEWWRAVMLKPEIVDRAATAYPGRTIILSDVDCIIRGPIDAILTDADVALHVRVKLSRRHSSWVSSRFVAFHPTAKGREVLRVWLGLTTIEMASSKPRSNEEQLLLMALSRVGGHRLWMLPEAYAAHEIDEVGPEAVVVHQSVHDDVRLAFNFWREVKARRRAFVSWVVGRPYEEWKYRIPRTS